MARPASNTNQSRVKDPAEIYVEIQNGGGVNAYDTKAREALQGYDTNTPHIFVDRAFFKYDLEIKGGEKVRDHRSGIYRSKNDRIRVYDQNGDHTQTATPGELKEQGFQTGFYVWGINREGKLIRFEFTSTGVQQWADFRKLPAKGYEGKTVSDFAPDFKFAITENLNHGKNTLGKFYPVFEWVDLELNPEAELRLNECANALADFFTAKGVGEKPSQPPVEEGQPQNGIDFAKRTATKKPANEPPSKPHEHGPAFGG